MSGGISSSRNCRRRLRHHERQEELIDAARAGRQLIEQRGHWLVGHRRTERRQVVEQAGVLATTTQQPFELAHQRSIGLACGGVDATCLRALDKLGNVVLDA